MRYKFYLLGLVSTVLCCTKAPSIRAGDAPTSPDSCDPSSAAVVRFSTSDAITLEADLLTAKDSQGVALLLHMVPPSNDRSNYPQIFIDALLDRGVSVLNVDRRGAGNSEGVAKDAYAGPKGVLDAVAAYTFLQAHPCGFDMTRLVIVGASNGTTTALDFTVQSETNDALNTPAGLVSLSGGPYTESQNKIATSRGVLEALPMLFAYPIKEGTWNESHTPYAKGWQLQSYAPGAHGTGLFSSDSSSVGRVADFVKEVLD